MRITHVIVSMQAGHGGPPVIASCIAAAQAAKGHEVSLFSYDPGPGQDAVVQRLAKLPGGKLVKLHLVQSNSRLETLSASAARAAFREVVKDMDFVHIHAIWEPMLWACADEARAAHKPYCVVPHGMLDPWTLTQSPLKKKIALAVKVRSFLNHAAFLHLGNTDEQELIKPQSLSVPGEIIPNGVFLEEFANLPPKGSFYAKHPELSGHPFILFLSRLHYKKGLDFLADAYALVARERPDVRLVVAGSDDGYKATFEEMIARHNLTQHTHLVGPLYAEEKLAAFNDAACFCLPSRQEGFSIAITESLACGTPAVVTRDCHYPEVGTVGAGEVTALNADSVAQGLLKVLAADRATLGNNGRRLVQERFNWPAVADTTFAAYQRASQRRATNHH